MNEELDSKVEDYRREMDSIGRIEETENEPPLSVRTLKDHHEKTLIRILAVYSEDTDWIEVKLHQ